MRCGIGRNMFCTVGDLGDFAISRPIFKGDVSGLLVIHTWSIDLNIYQHTCIDTYVHMQCTCTYRVQAKEDVEVSQWNNP